MHDFTLVICFPYFLSTSKKKKFCAITTLRHWLLVLLYFLLPRKYFFVLKEKDFYILCKVVSVVMYDWMNCNGWSGDSHTFPDKYLFMM